MILEGIVTTLSPDDSVNIAPMGPEVGPEWRTFVLKPFRTAETYRNLKRHGEGVIHVTDNVLLLAQTAVGKPDPPPNLARTSHIRGFYLTECCRYFEFRVRRMDDRQDRTRIEVEVLESGRLRDFFGFNRAKHAVLEAAILATRTDFLPLDDIDREFRKLELLVQKTGGEAERQAFAYLQDYLHRIQQDRMGQKL